MQYEAQLEEYRALKTEIVANLASARQVVSLTLTAVGALIAAIPVAIDRNAGIVFLIAPLLFYALAWTQLRYTFLVVDMGNYLRKALIPALRESAQATHVGERDNVGAVCELMTWEYWPASLLHGKSILEKLIVLPIAGANMGIPLLASVGSFVGYFMADSADSLPLVWGLAIIDCALFAYTAYWGLRVEQARSADDEGNTCPSN